MEAIEKRELDLLWKTYCDMEDYCIKNKDCKQCPYIDICNKQFID